MKLFSLEKQPLPILNTYIKSGLQSNIWALFVNPGFEKLGIGKQLHNTMLHWYFSQSENKLWLGTAPNTRAEKFYRAAGWKQAGQRPNGEIKFEMSHTDWQQAKLKLRQ